MLVQLMPYSALSSLQRRQLLTITLPAAQQRYSGDIDSALYQLLNKPTPELQGVALLGDQVPLGFLLLRTGSLLPPWAAPDAMTLHALQIDRAHQGQGLGRACLEQLPAFVRHGWPHARCLQLSVDTANHVARHLYAALDWRDDGQAYTHERRMTKTLCSLPSAADSPSCGPLH